MGNAFYDHPILNNPYDYPSQHWELDDQGQPTQQVISQRRKAEFITPIPKPKKRKGKATQQSLFAEHDLTKDGQQYDPTPIINKLRETVDKWRDLPNRNDWKVTPETARQVMKVYQG